MKKTLTIIAALALAFGMTQCKKAETPQTTTDEGVFVTFTATYGGERTTFDPTGCSFAWTENVEEYIYVGGSEHEGCLGTLSAIGNGGNTLTFTGNITPSDDETLHFFYLGKGKDGSEVTSLDFSSQDGNLDNLTDYHIAVGSATYNGSNNFSATLTPLVAFAYFDLSGFEFETVSISGDDVYSSATINYQNGTIVCDAQGSINVGTASENKYVALIPSTNNETTLNFNSSTKSGSLTFLRGIRVGKYYSSSNGEALEVTPAAPVVHIMDLSNIDDDYEAQNGDILTGTVSEIHKISIADGATVTLSGVNINIPSGSGYNYTYGGLTCLGNATIILEGENVVNGGEFPGITVSSGSSDTLTIEGTGRLDVSASPNYNSPSIGRRSGNNGGNINIKSGSIYANSCIGGTVNSINISGGYIEVIGGQYRSHAAIGSQADGTCGSINITGGEILATGGPNGGAGIGSGSGSSASCGAITISGASTIVATGGNSSSGDFGAGIGSGYNGSCGVITINSGDITATGAGARLSSAAGIGTGVSGKCADIIIGNGVTQVTSIRKNTNNQNGDRIGKGKNGNLTSGHLTIGGNTYDPDPTAVTGFTVTRNNTTWTIVPASN